MAISDKLQTLNSIKLDIQSAINAKGGSVGSNFTEYASAITNLPSGGGNNLGAFFEGGVTNIVDNNIEYIAPYTFTSKTEITDVSFPNVKIIDNDNFWYTSNITNINFNNCEILKNKTFVIFNNKLSEINFPKLEFLLGTGTNGIFVGLSASSVNINMSNLLLAYSVGEYMFSGSGIQSINFENLRWLEYYNTYDIFYSAKLSSINIPKCYKCTDSFKGLKSVLTTINLNNMVTLSGFSTFASCSLLSSINCKYLKSVERDCFLNCSSLSEISIPFVSSISMNAFSGCSNLTHIELPNCVNFGTTAFQNCINLKTIKLGTFSFLGNPPSNIFSNCSNLTSIYVQSECLESFKSGPLSWWSDKLVPFNNDGEYIYPYEFYGRSDLTEIPASKLNAKGVGHRGFWSALNLSFISLDSCEFITNDAFYNNRNITKINLSTCKILCKEAFANISKLSEIYAPEVLLLDERALYQNYSLISVYMPKCEIIGSEAFAFCSKLNNLNINNALIAFSNAFYSCINLSSINLPNLKYMSQYCFAKCSNIENISLPNLKVIDGMYGFYEGASNLSSVNLSNLLLITKADYLFYSASKLEYANFPKLISVGGTYVSRVFPARNNNNLKEIHLDSIRKLDSLLENCSKIENIYLATNVPHVINPGFSLSIPTTNLRSIYVPASLVSAYQSADGWSQYSQYFVPYSGN